MHQDYRTWEEVWQKQVKRPSVFKVSTLLDEEDMEQRSYDSTSVSESDPRSTSKTTEADITVPSGIETQPIVQHRWSGEDETWDTMVKYIRAKVEEQSEMEDVISEIDARQLSSKDTVQRRMSIANFL